MKRIQLRSGGLEWREIDGELVALETSNAVYLAANPAGTVLWQRLVEGATRTELSDALLGAYDIDPAIAERDVDAFLDQARELRLLEER